MEIMTTKEAAANLRAAADKIEQLEIDCEICVDVWFHSVKQDDMFQVLSLADGETELSISDDGEIWQTMEISKCRSAAFYISDRQARSESE